MVKNSTFLKLTALSQWVLDEMGSPRAGPLRKISDNFHITSSLNFHCFLNSFTDNAESIEPHCFPPAQHAL